MAIMPALIAAAGSIGGGLLANKGQPKPGDALFQPGIQTSPLYQQMMLMAMLGQGQRVSPQMMNAGSPLSTLLNAASQIGLKQKGAKNFSKLLPDLQRVISQGKAAGKTAAEIKADLEALPFWGQNKGDKRAASPLGIKMSDGMADVLDPLGIFDNRSKPDKEKGREVMRRLMAASGYNSVTDLIQAELDYENQSVGELGGMNEAADAAQKGRLDALKAIAGIQQDFVAPSGADIAKAISEQEAIIRAQIQREVQDQNESIITRNSAMGINPAAYQGRLGEWAAQANLEANTTGTARALQLLGGRQGLQSNALTALQGSINAADQTPLALMQLQSGNQIGLGQIAAQQAMNLAGLQQQGNTALGNGVSAGLGGIASWLAANQMGSRQNGLVGGQAAAPFDINSLDQYAGLTRG